MAIVRTRQPPATGPGLIGKAVRDLGGHPDRAGMAMAGGAAINLSQPLPVYRLGLDDIDDEHCIDKAVEIGWRYLIEPAGGVGGAGFADVRPAQGGEFKFTSLSQNANADRLLEAAHLAQQIGEGSAAEYEARILDVPAVYISAIWLAAPTPVFIPYIDPAHLGQPGAKVRVQPDFLKDLVLSVAQAKRHLNPGAAAPG